MGFISVLSLEGQKTRIQLIGLHLILNCTSEPRVALTCPYLLAIPKAFKRQVDMFAHDCTLPVNPMFIPC